jgi:metal-responsive CopG/Arc/MetJ family transcriptional regulator
MIRTQVYLPEDLYNQVKLLSMTGEGSFSELIREGLQAVIKTKTKAKKGSISAWKNFIGACKTDFKGKSGQELINDYYKNDVV